MTDAPIAEPSRNPEDVDWDREAAKDLEETVRHQDKRGHGSDRLSPGPQDPALRQFKERGVATAFATEYARQFGKQITHVRSVEDDPPDCSAQLAGGTIGIEITELVKGEMRRDNAADWDKREQKHLDGKFSPQQELEQKQRNYNRNYQSSLWTRREFLEQLQGLIEKKDGNSQLVDLAEARPVMLVIFTDDQNLPRVDVERWLDRSMFSANNLEHIFLLGPLEACVNAQPRTPSLENGATSSQYLFRLRIESLWRRMAARIASYVRCGLGTSVSRSC